MKKILLLLTLISGIFYSNSQQNNCSLGNGTFRYHVKLNITNLPSNFDKDDFINHIITLDNITNTNLDTLINHITSVYKTFPSLDTDKTVTVIATTEIYQILDSLPNSIEALQCVRRNCPWSDGTNHYYALLTLSTVPNDFNKDDFINLAVSLDNISSVDLATINASIISVFKSFPHSHSEFLLRNVTIIATSDLFEILDSLHNSIEEFDCFDEPALDINNYEKSENVIIYPNPITENSVIKLKMNSQNVKIEILNRVGQIVYHNKYSGNKTIELRNINIKNGIYFIKVFDITNGIIEILKIVKN